MLGIDYGSDSDSEEGQQPVSKPTSTQKPTPTASSSSQPNHGSTTSAKSSLGSLLPPPKSKKSAPKKIMVELPKLEKRGSDDDDELSSLVPAPKRPRLGGGSKSSSSSLLSMLPAPTKAASEAAAPPRVLGGGKPGLVFSKPSTQPKAAPLEALQGHSNEKDEEDFGPQEVSEAPKDTTTSMIPPSMLLKGKMKSITTSASNSTTATTNTTIPALDFFSLGSSSDRTAAPSSLTPPISISAAPKVEEFQPPSPKMDDPYPGYYQLPSGAWRMHDPAYYKIYTDRWAREYEKQIRDYERGQKGFEGAGVGGEDAEEITASALADAARAAREEKMSLTRNAISEGNKPVPKVATNASKTAGIARSRHQLHSLLADAFMNREAIEEKIAQGKRNRKEAGNKYGF